MFKLIIFKLVIQVGIKMNDDRKIIPLDNNNLQINTQELKLANSYSIDASEYTRENEVLNMSEYISRKEFEQFEKRMDEKLDTLTGKIDELPNRIEDKTKYQIAEMKNTQMKWFIATIITIASLAGRIFGIY